MKIKKGKITLNTINDRLIHLDDKFDALDKGVDMIDRKIDTKFNSLDKKIDTVQANVIHTVIDDLTKVIHDALSLTVPRSEFDQRMNALKTKTRLNKI